jgi:hypothetical protein
MLAKNPVTWQSPVLLFPLLNRCSKGESPAREAIQSAVGQLIRMFGRQASGVSHWLSLLSLVLRREECYLVQHQELGSNSRTLAD